MIELLSKPWPWYVAGPLLALVMLLLLWAGGNFGVSATLRSLCAMSGAGKRYRFFDFNWKNQQWNLVFVLGAILGGFIASRFLSNPAPLALSTATIQDLATLGISFEGSLAPKQLFNWQSLTTLRGGFILIIGGFLVGFGTRWAGGCTSGHAISGLSNLQLPSLIAVIGFFIGGLFMTFLLFPLIF
ncbi:MAG: YeeE/YedE family protein [Thermonemataceae bacterium]